MPDIVEQFRLDQEQVAENDARINADLLKTLASGEPGRAGELLLETASAAGGLKEESPKKRTQWSSPRRLSKAPRDMSACFLVSYR